MRVDRKFMNLKNGWTELTIGKTIAGRREQLILNISVSEFMVICTHIGSRKRFSCLNVSAMNFSFDKQSRLLCSRFKLVTITQLNH